MVRAAARGGAQWRAGGLLSHMAEHGVTGVRLIGALRAGEIGEWAAVCLRAGGMQEPPAPPVDSLPAESVANVDESLLESTVDDGAPNDTPVASERRAREGTITSLPAYFTAASAGESTRDSQVVSPTFSRSSAPGR